MTASGLTGQTGLTGLAGLRVLDLGWVWAGPLVGAVLAELGADVVKVESARRFDPYRMRGVERRVELGELRRESSPSFHKLNRGKQSIAVNLATVEGKELLLRLAGTADVLIDNFRAGTLERLGLGWPRLRAANPRLVAVSMSAGGQTGRWRNLKAYALITTGLAGYESLVGYPGEDPIGGPTFGVADPTVAAFGVLGALAGVAHARRTGRGRYLDMSGVECTMAILGPAMLAAQAGSAPLPCLHLTVRCAGPEAWLTVVLDGQDDVDSLVSATGIPVGQLPDWAALAGGPGDAGERLRGLVEGWSATRPVADARRLLAEAGLACAPVLTIEEATADPEIAGPAFELEHPVAGRASYLPSPWGSVARPTPAPLLGEHTRQVLHRWLGMDDAELDRLAADEVLR